MSQSEQKVVQYLGEARASEIGLVSVLRSQIAITPRGSYRDGLEKHMGETRKHAGRIQQRLGELQGARNPVQVIVGFTETLVSQTLHPGDFIGSGTISGPTAKAAASDSADSSSPTASSNSKSSRSACCETASSHRSSTPPTQLIGGPARSHQTKDSVTVRC